MANNSKRSGMSPVLAFILGFFLALVLVIGAVVGGVVYALNYKLDKLAFNKDEEDNYLYINADPEGETATVLQLVNKVLSMTNDTSSLTLGQVEETFPIANKLSDSLCDTLGQYIEIDKETLKQTTFSELGSFLQNTVMEVRPAALLDSFGGSLNDIALLRKVLYDGEDNPVTLRQISDGSALENLYETEVIELFDGNEDEYDDLTFTVLEGMKIGDLMSGELDFKDKVNGLTLNSFVPVTLSGDKLSTDKTILCYVIYGLTDIKANGGAAYSYTATYNPVDDGEKVPCFVEVDDSGKIIKVSGGDGEEIKGTAVKEISNRMQRVTTDLTVGQLMDVSGNDFLVKLGNSTIANLADDISNLTINELYADNIYTANTNGNSAKPEIYLAVDSAPVKAEYNSAYVYYVYRDGEYELASTTGKLTAEEYGEGDYLTCGEGKVLFDSSYVYYVKDAEGNFVLFNKDSENDKGKVTAYSANTYYTYGAANAMWKLLLYSNGSETTFSVNGFTKMIENVSANVQKSTLRELHEAGIVNMSKNGNNNLDKPIVTPGEHQNKLLGDLTLEELLDFFSDIATGSALPV